MQVDQTRVRSRRVYICDRTSMHMHASLNKRGVVTCNIYCVFNSFSRNSFDCILYKNSQFTIKRCTDTALEAAVMLMCSIDQATCS